MTRWFNEFAEATSRRVSRAPFFAICVFSVLLWALSGPFVGFSNVWQLVINTATTIITFLLVALLQNTQQRFDDATNHKLNAIADALADFMQDARPGLEQHVDELRKAVGIERDIEV